MIRFQRGRRVWVRSGPTDMRKGFAGLAALVQRDMGHDLVAGDLFVFISRDRRLLKLVAWDGSGLVMYSKRIARGRFAEVWRYRRNEQIELPLRVLHDLLAGVDVTLADGWKKSRI